MRAYFNIIKEMHQNDEFISTLNESQLASLLDIAENGLGIARGYARNILVQYGLWADPLMQEDNLKYSFAENVDLPPKAGEYMRLKNLIKGYKDNIITLYPNPAKDYLIVEFTFEGLSNNVKLQILSADGKTVKQLDIADNEKKAVIYVGGFASGVYTLALFNGNKMLSHEKFNVIK